MIRTVAEGSRRENARVGLDLVAAGNGSIVRLGETLLR